MNKTYPEYFFCFEIIFVLPRAERRVENMLKFGFVELESENPNNKSKISKFIIHMDYNE